MKKTELRRLIREEVRKLNEGTSEYAWIIDKDIIENGSDNGVIGPRNADKTLIKQLKSNKKNGDKFRLYDDDEELYYEGRIIGEFDGFEPLDDFGEPNSGCTMIKYLSGPNRGGFL